MLPQHAKTFSSTAESRHWIWPCSRTWKNLQEKQFPDIKHFHVSFITITNEAAGTLAMELLHRNFLHTFFCQPLAATIFSQCTTAGFTKISHCCCAIASSIFSPRPSKSSPAVRQGKWQPGVADSWKITPVWVEPLKMRAFLSRLEQSRFGEEYNERGKGLLEHYVCGCSRGEKEDDALGRSQSTEKLLWRKKHQKNKSGIIPFPVHKSCSGSLFTAEFQKNKDLSEINPKHIALNLNFVFQRHNFIVSHRHS